MGKSDSHIVLYRKYRSRSFDEVVGQDHIITPLKQEVKEDRIAHAYLFTGPRGTGKTSVARIFAFAINGLDYEDQLPIDIIEIDGASNRRIDEIRELKERIHVAPVQAKYKVYIIDEVHMLTKEAFNALLKTLEEPPAHAVFILATTEVHKMPATIISRTQRHSFRTASIEEVTKHLQFIADKEGFKTEPQALETIARFGQGSLRDSISLLDQVSSTGDVSVESVENSLGIVDTQHIASLVGSIENETPKEIVATLQDLIIKGSSATQLSKQVIDYLRTNKTDSEAWFDLIDSLIEVSNSLQPEVALEVALLRANLQLNPDAKLIHAKTPETVKKVESKKEEQPQPTEQKPKVEEGKTRKQETPEAKKYGSFDEQSWDEVLKIIKQTNNALYSVLRMSKPAINGDELNLSFKFEFHRKQAESSKNAEIITSTVKDITGQAVSISTNIDPSISVSTEPAEPEPAKQEVDEDKQPTSDVIQTFGGGEVVKL